MSGFSFDLVERVPERRRERKSIYLHLVGTAGPYGEVSLKITNYPQEATLVADGLPDATISNSGTPYGHITIDERTRLTVGGVTARLSRNRRALRKEDRGISIELGDRRYTYLCGPTGREELRDSERGPVVRQGNRRDGAVMALDVLPDADATDLALALVMQGADRLVLTVGGAIVSGVMSFLNSSEGNK
ncbi:hypothetical protein GCM10010116_58790 [Microbispora rosea subsp. aerata]|nr:hypothetical protein [Microbispora rosea]GGO29338.1 hypothetical protein GCM10010116_58790 [Microbispora rosea subsp. aerata]GIH58933.1 hypothetical protein Mro02_58470 [Microbispora rosea subsp. aerata]GLJ85880.1 hypothetical protein GCM10017588_46130 [Microbispora rosea subsp. aerata]